MNYHSLKILADDKNIISYRKNLRPICGDLITATILFQQILYWWFQNKEKPFYKYRMPLKQAEDESDEQFKERAKFYNEGDSWCEELGFSRTEFDLALKRIAHKRGEDVTDSDKYPIKPFIEYYTNLTRITYYNICDVKGLNIIIDNYYSKIMNPDLRSSNNPDLRDSANMNENKDTETTSKTTSESFSKEKDISPETGEALSDESEVSRKRTPAYLPPKKPLIPENVRTSCEAVINYWNTKKLVKHKPGSKRYEQIITLIYKFMTGKFPIKGDSFTHLKEVKFLRRDFKKSIDQFDLAANDPDYEYAEGSRYKESLRKMPMSDFLWNTFTNGEVRKSLFLYFFENDAKLLKEKYVKDEYPELTKAIAEEYTRKVLGNKNIPTEKGPYIKAAKKLQTFLNENQHRLNKTMIPTNEKLASWLIDAVLDHNRGREIPSYFLHSKPTFDEHLPLYLQNQAIFRSPSTKTVSHYKTVRPEETSEVQSYSTVRKPQTSEVRHYKTVQN